MEKDLRQVQAIYSNPSFASKQGNNQEVQHLREVLFSLSGDLLGKRVLFLGCGDGAECIPYGSAGAVVYGIDISPLLVKRARRLNPTGRFMVGDFHNIAPQNSFDLIIAVLSLHYSKGLDDSLSKIYSLLRPGAACLIATPHPVHKMITYNKGNYFKRGKVWYSWQGIKRFNYLYLIEDYINGFAQNGLYIERMAEVFTPANLRSVLNKDKESPIFAIYKARKPGLVRLHR